MSFYFSPLGWRNNKQLNFTTFFEGGGDPELVGVKGGKE